MADDEFTVAPVGQLTENKFQAVFDGTPSTTILNVVGNRVCL